MDVHRTRVSSRVRRGVALATMFGLAFGILAPAVAAEMATFTGTVIGTDNSLAQGFTVIFKDVATGQEFKSAATSAAGEYQVSVPVGGRYKLDSVLAPDGAKLPVQNVPPVPVRVAGSNRMDVKFTSTAPAAAAAAPAAAGAAAAGTDTAVDTPPTAEEKEKKDKSGTPWWKKPGGITGIVLGAVAIGALALSGGDDDNPTEPQCDNSASCSGPNCCPDR